VHGATALLILAYQRLQVLELAQTAEPALLLSAPAARIHPLRARQVHADDHDLSRFGRSWARPSTHVGSVYDNSVTRISVEAVSFGASTDCGDSVDLVSAFHLMPDGESDYIGVLRLLVEPVVPSPGPTPTASPCGGDCDGNAAVSIDELLTCVNIALDALPASACAACEPSPDTEVTPQSCEQSTMHCSDAQQRSRWQSAWV